MQSELNRPDMLAAAPGSATGKNTAKCVGCGRDFEYVPVQVGSLLYVSTSGEEVRCKKEVAPVICPKCLRGCKVKDGRP